jgi:hypothetical protein
MQYYQMASSGSEQVEYVSFCLAPILCLMMIMGVDGILLVVVSIVVTV